MNNNEIIVTLETTEDKKELLVFDFDNKISIDLTSTDQNQLKTFFLNLLKEIEGKNIVLKYNAGERNDLFADVAEKYVTHLKNEISSINGETLTQVELASELEIEGI